MPSTVFLHHYECRGSLKHVPTLLLTHRRSQKRKCLQLLLPVERDRRRNLQTVVTHHAGKDLSNKIVETCEDILFNLSSTDTSPSIITTRVANNFKAIFKNKQILYCNVCL